MIEDLSPSTECNRWFSLRTFASSRLCGGRLALCGERKHAQFAGLQELVDDAVDVRVERGVLARFEQLVERRFVVDCAEIAPVID